jgi:hypothetical protein
VSFQLDLDYIDVAARIVEFRTKHPEGSLQQVALDFKEVAGKWWVIYTAAAYRAPDDERPGIGTAWEPVPGKTNFTRDSELQNAETAAWGRAIVAALAADTKRGIASAQEVRNRRADQAEPEPVVDAAMAELNLAKQDVKDAWEAAIGEFSVPVMEAHYKAYTGHELASAGLPELNAYAKDLREGTATASTPAETVHKEVS